MFMWSMDFLMPPAKLWPPVRMLASIGMTSLVISLTNLFAPSPFHMPPVTWEIIWRSGAVIRSWMKLKCCKMELMIPLIASSMNEKIPISHLLELSAGLLVGLAHVRHCPANVAGLFSKFGGELIHFLREYTQGLYKRISEFTLQCAVLHLRGDFPGQSCRLLQTLGGLIAVFCHILQRRIINSNFLCHFFL